MSTNQSSVSLDEYGAPIRKLEPDLCCNETPTDPAPAVTEEVWVTPALQTTAREFEKSWDVSLTENLAKINTDSVAIKFKDAATKNRFLAALRTFAENYSEYISSGVPLPVGETSGAIVGLRLEYFRPDAFDEIVRDVAQTRRTAVPCPTEIAELARLYHSAFSIPFIRADLQADENVDRTACDVLEAALVESQQQMAAFLKELVACLPTQGVYRVLIHNVNQIEVDGCERQFTGAAKRALLAVALLRNRPTFGTDDFARLYNGEQNPVEARHDFDNAMKALLVELPNVGTETVGRRKRKMKNLNIKVEVADSELHDHLSMLY